MRDISIIQREYPPGTTLKIKSPDSQNGTEFIIIEYDLDYPGLVKLISKETMWNDIQFGDGSNWKSSSLRKELNSGYMYDKIKSIFGTDKLYFFSRNTVSIDGFKMESCIDVVSLLTLEEYGQSRYVFWPRHFNDPWWLLTPRSTSIGGDGNSVFFVQDNGIVDFQDSNCKCGVRPVVTTDISILAKSEGVKDGG